MSRPILTVIFDPAVYEYSDRAIKDGIDNSIPADLLPKIEAHFTHVVVPCLAQFPGLVLSSGYRSPALNAAVGSKTTKSQHTRGEAGDLDVDDKDLQALYNYILRNLPYDQIIYESYGGKRWVHCSYAEDGRRASHLRTDDGKTFVVQEFFA